jgi:hypothetical protein
MTDTRDLVGRNRPHLGCEAAGGLAGQQPGDDVDMPQAGAAGGEYVGGAEQVRGEWGGVEADPWVGLLGGGHTAAGSGPVPAQQIGQGRD